VVPGGQGCRAGQVGAVATKRRFSVQLDAPVIAALRVHAKARETSVAHLVRQATSEWLDAHQDDALQVIRLVVPPHRDAEGLLL
jgi:ribbon-helix-helix CopG family protein